MKRFQRVSTSIVALAALLISGCGGSSGGPSTAQTDGVLPQVSAQRATSLNSSVPHAFAVSSFEHARHHDDEFKIVALLKIDVSGSNASFEAHDSWNCDSEGERSDNEWGHGFIYTPNANESLAIPSFGLENPCRSHEDGGDNRDEEHHHHHGDGHYYYIVDVAVPDFSTTVVAGPGGLGPSAAAPNDDLLFPAANAPMSLVKGTSYAFLLVRTDEVMPTPTPLATSTPLPTPTPCSGKNCGTPTPSPTQTPSPTPVPTATPTPCVGKNCP